SITAVYSGDATNAGSTSAVLTQTVKAIATVSLVSSVNPSTVGQSVSFTATVTPSTATGTVQFKDGGTVLSTVAVSSGSAGFSTGLPAGAHSMTAVYSGDALDTAATSAVLTQSVLVVTTTSLTSSPNPSTFGNSVTLTATVTPSSTTGTVQFFN